MKASLLRPEIYEPVRVLGVEIHPLAIPDLNALIAVAVEGGERWVIGHHNLNSVQLSRCDPEMCAFYEKADFVHADGMPLITLGRWLGYRLQPEHRVTYVDWLGPLMEDAARSGWRIFYLGSRPGTADRGAEILRARHPGLQIATAHGYFDPEGEENQRVLASIATYAPHILMVGMGMPRQERWINRNRHRVPANVILPCGACMDYVTGEIYTPPRWAGRTGLEWLFRLCSEPNRLWRRYLVEPWRLLPLLLADLRSARARRPRVRGDTMPARSPSPKPPATPVVHLDAVEQDASGAGTPGA